MIRAFDAYGREIFIARDEWRTNVLPANLQAQWSSPDGLYGVILHALDDGFDAEVLDAAARLRAIDPIPARGACIHGIVLMKNGRLDEAERVLVAHLERHGAEGVVLTNLAKVYAEKGETRKAEATLWRALEADPNQSTRRFPARSRETRCARSRGGWSTFWPNTRG
jgi:Flp pilus assembly protein TadD